MIRQLPASYALVVRGGHSPVVARLPMCWKDPLYSAARHAGRVSAEVIPLHDSTRALPPAVPAGQEPGSADEPEPAEVLSFPVNTGGTRRHPWDE